MASAKAVYSPVSWKEYRKKTFYRLILLEGVIVPVTKLLVPFIVNKIDEATEDGLSPFLKDAIETIFETFLDFVHAAIFVSILHSIYTASNKEVKITGNAPGKAIGYAQISFALFGVALELFSRTQEEKRKVM